MAKPPAAANPWNFAAKFSFRVRAVLDARAAEKDAALQTQCTTWEARR